MRPHRYVPHMLVTKVALHRPDFVFFAAKSEAGAPHDLMQHCIEVPRGRVIKRYLGRVVICPRGAWWRRQVWVVAAVEPLQLNGHVMVAPTDDSA